MIYKLCLGIKCQLLYFWRLKRNSISMLLCWLYCSSIFILYMPDNDPLAMVQDSFYGQAFTMLLFMVYGMQLWQQEQDVSADELLITTSTKAGFFVVTKLVVLLILAFALSTLIGLSNLVAFLHMKMPGQVIQYAFKMIGVNYLMPMYNSALVGMIIGNLVSSRGKYAVLIFTWLVTSPFSIEISSYAMSLLGHENKLLSYVFALLNFGSRMQTGATPMYGISFDPYRCVVACIRTLFLLCWILAMNMLSLNHLYRKLCKCAVSLCMLILGFAAITLSYTPSAYKSSIYAGIPESKRANYDSNYYYTEIYRKGNELAESALPPFDANRYLTVKQMEISLDVDLLTMNVECKLVASVDEDITQQSFTLYRDLIVNSILMDGIPQEFIQSGDYVNVLFSDLIPAGEEIVLAFTYAGSPSPIFTATNSAVYLNAKFPWLPECGLCTPLTFSPYSKTDLMVLYGSYTSSSPIEYILHYSSPYTTYVNLDQVSQSEWRGVSADGISIYSDALMCCSQIQDLTIYYPAAVEPKLERILGICQNSVNVLKHVEQLLGIKTGGTYSTILLLPVAPTIEYVGVIRNYRMHEDMMLYFESGFYLEGYMGRTSDMTAIHDAVSAITNTPECIYSFVLEPVNQMFVPCLIRWYCNNYDLPLPMNKWGSFEALQSHIATANKYDPNQLTLLDQLVNQLDNAILLENQQLPALLRQWYTRISTGNPPTINEITAMIEGE